MCYGEMNLHTIYITNSELSRGDGLARFRWDAGSNSDMALWNEHLPNDCEVRENF